MARWREVGEGLWDVGLSLCVVHVGGLWWVVAKVERLLLLLRILVVGLLLLHLHLHLLVHVVVLAHGVTTNILLQILLIVHVDGAAPVLLIVLNRAILTLLRRNNLDVTMIWQQFHIWRAVEEDLARDGR